MIRYLAIVLAFAVGIVATPLARAETWITVEEAKKAIASGGDVVVIDARAAKDYAAGHIAGAISAPWQSFADMRGRPGDANWGTVLPVDKLGEAIGGMGIGPSTRVIVYSAPPTGWGEDGRVAWTLRTAGVSSIAILDGGIEAWKADRGAMTAETSKIAPKSFTAKSADPTLTVSKEQVKAALGQSRIIDARASEEYAGAQKYGEPRGGHLPGAISLPWDKMFDEKGRVRSTADLKAVLTSAGVKPDDEIIAYCTKGIRSAHLVMVMREAGFAKARNYDASFYEWAGDTSLPLEK